MHMRPILTLCAAVATLALAGGTPSWAGDHHDHHKCCKIDVDIDELHADLYPDGDGWLLKVTWEIDVEDACDREHLVLHLEFSNDDHRVVDADGHPLTHTIALDRPSKCKHDEQTFEGAVD